MRTPLAQRKRPPRGRLVVAMATTTLVAACSSTARHLAPVASPPVTAIPSSSSAATPPTIKGGASSVTPPTSAAPGQPAPVPGTGVPASTRRRVTTPLTVGVLYSENTAAQQALGLKPDTGNLDPGDAAKAVAAYYNSHGGLAGRHLSVVYNVFGADDPSYETDLQAACAKFTQDNHVAVVLDMAGAWSENFQQCLASARVPYIGGAVYDDADLRRFPGSINPFDLSIDARSVALLDTLSASGYLSGSNRLGVVYEDCPDTARVYRDTLRPQASRLGLRVASDFAVSCVTGFASAGPGASQLQQAVLRFHSSGVDRVAFISHYESAAILLFARAAENAHYRPGYALSSNAGAGIYAASGSAIPRAQMANFHGAGWQPGPDTYADPGTPAASTCLALFRAEGLAPGGPDDRRTAYNACEVYFFLATVLEASAGVATFDALVGATGGLGSAYQSVQALDGATFFTPTRHDGAASVAAFAWSPTCSCVRYAGPHRRVTR